MAVPIKKTPAKQVSTEKAPIEDEYELLPHKDIVELREELRKLKSLPPEAGSHAESSYEELSQRMDNLIEIFDNAEKSLKVEDGAMSFKEKMAPFTEKLDKVLEQNSEIAEGIVALSDMVKEKFSEEYPPQKASPFLQKLLPRLLKNRGSYTDYQFQHPFQP